MESCINEYFIKNDHVYASEKFNEEYVVDGKCIYEVIRIIDGVPIFLKEHLLRFEKSLELAKESKTITMDRVNKIVDDLINSNNVENGNIKIVINKENIFMFSIKHSYPTEEMYRKGVKTILYFGERNNPNAKVIDNSFREKVNRKIEESNCYEAILVNHEGNITEGSKSNIFMVKGNEVFTAPVDGVLPGITREQIIKVCKELNLKVKEENINYDNIKGVDGLFISGTSPNVLPIREIEGIIEYSSIIDTIYKIKNQFDIKIKENLKNYKAIK
ncbi:MAG: aminotransferase class IV [Clostridium sp.]|uniref:aminotransferase class IV n=1 Tax=Clostridium sp. TaxID=1506 RepID=UPI00305FD222